MKKIVAVALVALLIVCQIPQNVFADAPIVTVNNTIGDLLVGYTGNDILTQSNYLNNYDNVSGYLKYCANSGIYAYNGNSDFGGNFETVIKNFVDNNTQSFMSIPFPEVEGYKFMYFNYWRGDYSPHLGCSVVVTEGNLYNVQGVLISDQPMYIYTNWTVFTNGGNNIGTTTLNNGTPTVTIDTKTSSYLSDYYVYDAMNTALHNTNPTMWIYSDIPFYMTAYKNSQYTEGDYLIDTYNYDSIAQVFNAIDNDTTGFVIDRRTEHMINESSGGGDNPTIDSNLGVIGGSFDCLLSADSLNNQKFLVVYDLNDYTKQIKNTINLKLNYQFFCDGQYQNNEFTFDGNFVDSVGYADSYNVNYSNYVTIDINKVFNNIYGSDLIAGDFGLDTMFQIGNQVNFNQNFYTANEFINSIMKIGGFSLSTRKNVDYYNKRSFWDNVADTVIDYLNYGFTEKSLQFNYNTSKETVFNDCYLLVTMYLENEQNNTCSDSYIYKYNYLDGTVSDVGGFEDDSVFSGNYPTTNSGSASYPSNNTGYGGSAYGGSAYGGSGGSASASTGDIYVYPGMTSLPYLLVDIPEDEWLNKTPNLKTILTDFKDALSEVKDNSILNVMSETYNYLPVPVWQYFTYGVGILIAIGIWRAITRR